MRSFIFSLALLAISGFAIATTAVTAHAYSDGYSTSSSDTGGGTTKDSDEEVSVPTFDETAG